MKVHVFFYAYPLIEEGLEYYEDPCSSHWSVRHVLAPVGAYLLFYGQWYRTRGAQLPPVEIEDREVPKPIRALALICVIN